MSTPLRRLKDDPDFLWETGCDLADEAFSTGGYNLPSMRANVLAATQAPSGGAPLAASAGSTRWPWVAGVTGVALLLLGFWGGSTFSSSDTVTNAPLAATVAFESETPSASVADPRPQGEVVVVVPEGMVSDAAGVERIHPPIPAQVAVVPTTVELVATEPVAAELASDGVVVVSEPEATAAAVEPPTTPSGLVAELAAYDRANDGLLGGNFAFAADGFDAYLEQYPTGRLRTESQMGLLHAYVGVGDREAVEVHAVALQDLTALAGKRDEILRMRAENLVHLDRCEDAIKVAQQLSGRDASNVRRACRWKQ